MLSYDLLFWSSGEFVVVNKHLLHDLTEMGLWNPTLKNKIIYEDGSVQKISEIPDDLKLIYKYTYFFISHIFFSLSLVNKYIFVFPLMVLLTKAICL